RKSLLTCRSGRGNSRVPLRGHKAERKITRNRRRRRRRRRRQNSSQKKSYSTKHEEKGHHLRWPVLCVAEGRKFPAAYAGFCSAVRRDSRVRESFSRCVLVPSSVERPGCVPHSEPPM